MNRALTLGAIWAWSSLTMAVPPDECVVPGFAEHDSRIALRARVSRHNWRRASLRRLLCTIALVVGWSVPAAAIGPDDPAATYYEACVSPSQEARVPDDEGCDALINDALMGIIVGQFDQEHPAFCYPQEVVDQMQTAGKDKREHPGQRSEKALSAISNFDHQMRAAVAHYMREHPERLSEMTLQVIFASLLQNFPCPG
jgi:hypothetical protein